MIQEKEFQKFWYGKRVFLTGHSGFKGSWLYFWLKEMGADVTGYSLKPRKYEILPTLLGIPIKSQDDLIDITNLNTKILETQPEIIFHLAAQSLVIESINDPVSTFKSNIVGTINLLECVKDIKDLKSVVIVTSDKCYALSDNNIQLNELAPLGGNDPYSASKACAELIVNSYKKTFFNKSSSPKIVTARAGNVIGGGDFSSNRIIPDIIRAIESDKKIIIRNPEHVRPWQHVLDPIYGYMLLAKYQFEGKTLSNSYNFGPSKSEDKNVRSLVTEFTKHFNNVGSESEENLHKKSVESNYLSLDSSLAKNDLNWSSKFQFEEAVSLTAEWYDSYLNRCNMSAITLEQIKLFTNGK
jgi:CDP-glucose 4,6-dehydratase